MKAFWIKLVSLAVVIAVIALYQLQALSNAEMKDSLEAARLKLGAVEEPGDEAGADLSSEDEAPSSGTYKDGEYTGTGTGYKGDIHVRVKIGNGNIENIEVLDTLDDMAYFSQAEKLVDSIIEEQTTEGIDAVSGATFSSNGLLEAVSDALKGAE